MDKAPLALDGRADGGGAIILEDDDVVDDGKGEAAGEKAAGKKRKAGDKAPDGDKAAAPPGQKKPKTEGGGAGAVKNLSTAKIWPRSDLIFGLHESATREDVRAAKKILDDTSMVHCRRCSAQITCHKTSWESHIATVKCNDAEPGQAFNPGLLRYVQVGAPKKDPELITQLVSSCLLAGGISFNTQSTLFGSGGTSRHSSTSRRTPVLQPLPTRRSLRATGSARATTGASCRR